ncbi:hypothetical protein FBZ87_102351 [Nitrospirillum amazonense]|uniref:Uncharacterized protein n=1 Tax=Nitrospirillum amazonense TaxID=28077 RepID=A0A560KA70_9PROT|nr:hypothetical protein [Nitrospirillum amazonense]TWB79929.1 hypothetical protein FBZ87_102351 [Nitrospirillum amazonense]
MALAAGIVVSDGLYKPDESPGGLGTVGVGALVMEMSALRERLRAAPVFLGFAAVGGGLLCLALFSLLPIAHDLGADAPLITLAPRDATGLPLAVTLFAFAAMTLFRAPKIDPARRDRSRTKQPASHINGPVICLGVAFLGIVLAFLASPITTGIVEKAAASHGYIACPALPGEHPAHLRWTRDTLDHCPLPRKKTASDS